MKRLRSYGDDLASVGEKEVERTTASSTTQNQRRFYKGSENGRSRQSPVVMDDDRDREGSVSRGRKRGEHEFSREGFEEREGFRGVRKRVEYDSEGFDRRKGGFDRYGGRERERERDRERDGGLSMLSPRGGGYVGERERERERDRERIHRSESFCVSRREFPKGFRSERNWSRREDGGSSSWRRFDSRGKKDVDEDSKSSPIEKGSGGGGGGGSSSSKGGGMDSGGGGGGVSSSKESLRSPRGIKDVKSPTWSKDSTRDSKDSVTEHTKDVKRNESIVVDSGGNGNDNGYGNGSEMEEGELQPELNQVQAEKNVKNGEEKACELNVGQINELGSAVSDAMDRKLAREDEKVPDEVVIVGGKQVAVVEVANNATVKGAKLSFTGQNDSGDEIPLSEETKSFIVKGFNDEGRLMENQSESPAPINNNEGVVKMEEHEPKDMDNSSPDGEQPKVRLDTEVGLGESNKAIVDEIPKDLEPCAPIMKDKGKGVVVCSPGEASPTENNLLVERNFIAFQNDAMEGSSVRGFELFSSSAGLKTDCTNRGSGSKDSEKLKLEPLDLSLSLHNVSAPTASNSVAASAAVAPPALPSSPPRARSVQSFGTTLRTGSDCFTTSISFSGSQFIHNPSCSLTHNSVDYDFEQSVKSRPLFQGVDWQALSGSDTLPKEILANSKLGSTSNANGSLHLSQSSQSILNGRALQQTNIVGVDLSGSLHKHPSGKTQYQDDLRSPAYSAGSHDTKSEYGRDKKRLTGEDSVSRLIRSSSQREIEQGVAAERELVERLIFLVASEPIQSMAWKVNEMPERSIAFLKDTVCEIIVKEENQRKLRALQDVLRKRLDLNLETLLKSHRVQLQIMVALKTSLPDFVQRADSISSSDLAEIYLNLKCRNINCKSALPVDECDCKFCSQKDGYCSSCMCLVCSKFDTASNTCGWVGCDVCNHWCHTECGLLKYYIRNGRSAAGPQGTSEMQFYCLACDHPSEMFGFVKDVFKTCALEWKSETFAKELEYVRRIFSGSNDYRGKVLHDAAKQLIVRLQSGANPVEICKQIMAFLNEGDNRSANALGSSGRDQFQPEPIENNRGNIQDVATHSQEPIWSKPNSSKELSRMETLPKNEGSAFGGSLWSTETLTGKSKDSGDGLDSIVKIKLAEAQLFQKRADAARKEAEDLQRIANAKNDKVEEEYTSRIAKLRLSGLEERRRLKHEELQMLERSHREYFNMKTRMETDIKDLLLKMEATKRNLST